MNRLHLNWELASSDERAQFLQSYLASIDFEPTSAELETCADYVLWGKDSTGFNASQAGDILLEGKSKTWTRDKKIESLDALIECPTFNEQTLKRAPVPTAAKRTVFSRNKALAQCPPHLVDTFKALFRSIDELDLAINLYDIAHGRRTKPPRQELEERFTEDERAQLEQSAAKWTQRKYLQKRHLLVELRREQYTLRDTYVSAVMRETLPEPEPIEEPPQFGLDVPVFPLGHVDEKDAALVFRGDEDLNPFAYSEAELGVISKLVWRKRTERPPHYFDFADLECVYELIGVDEDDVEGTIEPLLRTLDYYVERAGLTDSQKDILALKREKRKNQDIADYVNGKYGTSYTANYISTVFRQKIIVKINEAALLHKKIVENLFFEEDFKKCSKCGQWKLRTVDLFTRKKKSKDGFAARCKCCDKEVKLNKVVKEEE